MIHNQNLSIMHLPFILINLKSKWLNFNTSTCAVFSIGSIKIDLIFDKSIFYQLNNFLEYYDHLLLKYSINLKIKELFILKEVCRFLHDIPMFFLVLEIFFFKLWDFDFYFTKNKEETKATIKIKKNGNRRNN